MNIYIDESGTFTGYALYNQPSVVGALIVPESAEAELTKSYANIRNNLPKEKNQVKGKLLDERQVCIVLEWLEQFPVLFEANVIDLGCHTSADIEAHRLGQLSVFEKNKKIAIHRSMQNDLEALRITLAQMSQQLYVQSVLTFELANTVINHGMLYFVQRKPSELGHFNWIIDSKGASNVTAWEDWWQQMIPAMLQSKTNRDPVIMLKGADYSHFKRFEMPWPKLAPPELTPPIDGQVINLKLLMQESFRFSSLPEMGLELVDILTNTLRRVLKGHLKPNGWRKLPNIMVHRPTLYFRALGLFDTSIQRTAPKEWPAEAFRRDGRNMLT